MTLTVSQRADLATLAKGPAERTNGHAAPGQVNRMSVIVLCRLGLAVKTGGKTFEITEAGRREHEAPKS